MEKDKLCVFCGRKLGAFRSAAVVCGDTSQLACWNCEKELRGLDDAERCRRALVLGLAEWPDELRERIALSVEAEKHRPKCTQCGGSLLFSELQELDNSPIFDSAFIEPFDVIPACCEVCGKYEFYNPAIVKKNPYLVYLISRDVNRMDKI